MNRSHRTAILELTYKCNFACPFCYVPRLDNPEIHVRELSTAEWKRVIREMSLEQVSSLTFTGGEPLMRRDFLELFAYAKSETRIPRLVVYSNLSLADDAFLAAIDDPRVEVSTSLQGYRKISEMSGCERSLEAFEIVCRRITNTQARLSIGVTITRSNAYEIEDILQRADALSPETIQASVMMIEGRAQTHPELWMSFEEIVSAHERIESCRARLKANLVVVNELYCACRDDVIKPVGLPHDYVPDECEAERAYVVVGPNGLRRKCMHIY